MEPPHPTTSTACAAAQELLSAQHDGEATTWTADLDRAHDHAQACEDCGGFLAGIARLGAVTPALLAPAPGRAMRVASTVVERHRQAATDRLRGLVAFAGVVQLIVALPVLVGLTGPDLHAGRDLGALQLALGVGLLFAAAQPKRAAGVLPVAAAVAGLTVILAIVDVAGGAVTLVAELTHVAELVGVAALWALARRTPTEVAARQPMEAW